MIPRQIKYWLWNAPGRGTALRAYDRVFGSRSRLPDVSECDPYPCARPRQEIAVVEGSIVDPSRNIAIGYKLYHPREPMGRMPAIIFSPGFHFSPEVPAPRTRFLAEHLASHGYLVMHLRHIGSDAVFMPEPGDEPFEPMKIVRALYGRWSGEPDRMLDISFAIDTLEAWDEGDGPIAGRLDRRSIGVSGYCFGARTVMAAMGEAIGQARRSFKDNRICAGIIYSAGQGWPPGAARRVFDAVDLPVMHMSGTRARAYADIGVPEDKMGAYEGISARHQYGLVLKGADHMVFSGERPGGAVLESDARHHQLIKNAALAFWDAYLKDDERARDWLGNDFARLLGREGKFHHK